MSEMQIANELLHGNLCGSQHFLLENCTTLQSIERIRDLSRPASFFFIPPFFPRWVLFFVEMLAI